jgi:DNA-binding GntR family transcriptional regulator
VSEASDRGAHLPGSHYDRVKRDLLAGQYPPGTVLLETVLGERYGVSRTPMREALARLAQDGFIERSAKGFVVRVRTPEEIMEIYETRIILESSAAALAAVRRSDYDLSRLEHLAQLRRVESDPTLFAGLNDRWHIALRESAHNSITLRVLSQLDGLITIYRLPARSPDVHDPSIDEHERVLAAIRARDAEEARASMGEHLERMRDIRIASLATLGD